MKNVKVLIFTDNYGLFKRKAVAPEFADLESSRIMWADSSKYSREYYINENLREWLLFLDHDCSPAPGTLATVTKIVNSTVSQENLVYAGSYVNPAQPRLLQRVHNFIANGWVEHAFLQGQCVLLGGVFLIFGSERVESVSKFIFWGAEDKALSAQLHKQGFKFCYLPDLSVIHDTSPKFSHFIRRAWLHGKNEVRFVPQTGLKINFAYWLRKVDFADLSLVLLVLLHFCIQKTALLFQTVRQGNKPDR